MESTKLSRYDTLAYITRGLGLAGGIAAYGYYLVTWLGEQNLDLWGGNKQLLAAAGIAAGVVFLMLGIGCGLPFRSPTHRAACVAGIWAVASTIVGWLSLCILWLGPGTVERSGGGQQWNSVAIMFLIFMILYSIGMIVLVTFCIDEMATIR